MSGSLRLALVLLAVVFGGYFLVKVASAVIGWFIGSLLIPLAAIALIGGAVYLAVDRKVLGGRRRTLP